ncbi:MAG: DUF2849 domain-containing protein [Hyphomicrobiales bacterium]
MTSGKILTANRLTDGLVVFLSAENIWTRDIDRAVLAQEEGAQSALAKRGEEYEENNQVTGAYLIDAERENGIINPVRIRERIRLTGPTILEAPAQNLHANPECCHV